MCAPFSGRVDYVSCRSTRSADPPSEVRIGTAVGSAGTREEFIDDRAKNGRTVFGVRTEAQHTRDGEAYLVPSEGHTWGARGGQANEQRGALRAALTHIACTALDLRAVASVKRSHAK